MRFDDIVQPLVRVVEETVAPPDTDLRFEVDGDAGTLPGDLATPLAVVLNELMQNAVDHAFPRVDGRVVGPRLACSSRATTVSSWSTWSTTASGCRPGFIDRAVERASGCRSCRRS